MSEAPPSQIYAALAAVMKDCDHVAKRDVNQHQRFHFRGIDAVVNAVGPVLRKHKVIVTPNIEHVTYDTVQTSTGKPATACRVLATYSFHAEDGSSIDTRVAAEAWDAGDKAAPKAMSVAFRTALLQALALPTDEPDPDSQTYERANAPQQRDPWPEARQPGRPAAASKAQIGLIGTLMSKRPDLSEREPALAYVEKVIGRKVASRNELTAQEAGKVIDALQAEAPKEGGQ